MEVGDGTAFRGVGIIEGSPEKLVGVINNPSRWKFWVDDLDEGKLLEKKSDFFSKSFPLSRSSIQNFQRLGL